MTDTSTSPPAARIVVPNISGSVIEQAIALANVGFKVITIHAPLGDDWCTCRREECREIDKKKTARGKHPIAKLWQNNPLVDEQLVRDAFSRLKFTPNIGIVLGEQQDGEYLIAVDVDEEDRLKELVEELGELPETVTSSSSKGRYRMLFCLPSGTQVDQLKNITGLGKKKGIDVKVKGGQILAPPSSHPSGSKYAWTRVGEIAELPSAWTIAILPAKKPVPGWAATYTPQTLKDDRHAQRRADKWLQSAVISEASLLARMGEGGRNTALHTSLCRILPMAHGVGLAGSGHAYVVRELSAAAKASGLHDREIAQTVASAEKWLNETSAIRVMPNRQDSVPPPAEEEHPPLDREIKLILDNGAPAKCATNVARLLSEHPIWGGGPKLNLFIDRVEWPQPLPEPLHRIHRLSRELIDADEVAIQGWLLSQPFSMRVKASIDVVSDGAKQAARWAAVDSLKTRIEQLPKWDGAKRLDDWLTTYAGASGSSVTRMFGRRWLISAVARALNPGCIADGALVLEGEQGIGKNRLITSIFGDAPWVQSIGSYKIGHDVEADRIAGASWVVHDDEMGARRSDVDALKSWISRREDTYRAPYERNLQTRPRRAVIVCSTNRLTYLQDDKNRRFWPVKCGKIDWERAAKESGQLLAEALVAFRANQPWTIAPADPLWREVELKQDARRFVDPIVSNIEDSLQRLGNPKEITISKLADDIGLRPSEIDRSLESRYGMILREMGYLRYRARDSGSRSYVYRLGPTPGPTPLQEEKVVF